jgi:hypothetical protein
MSEDTKVQNSHCRVRKYVNQKTRVVINDVVVLFETGDD